MNIIETNLKEVKKWPDMDGIKTDPRLIQIRQDYSKNHGSFEPKEFQFAIVEDEDGKHYAITSKFGPICANTTDRGQAESLFRLLAQDSKNKDAIFTLWEYPKKAVSLVAPK
jgi:hypothetical protein